jgi:hypothetical protein
MIEVFHGVAESSDMGLECFEGTRFGRFDYAY